MNLPRVQTEFGESLPGSWVVLVAQLVYPLEMGLWRQELGKLLWVCDVGGEEARFFALCQVPVVRYLQGKQGSEPGIHGHGGQIISANIEICILLLYLGRLRQWNQMWNHNTTLPQSKYIAISTEYWPQQSQHGRQRETSTWPCHWSPRTAEQEGWNAWTALLG